MVALANGLHPQRQLVRACDGLLGESLRILRALPTAPRRLVGPWCFLDYFGPVAVADGGMKVDPHPHTGLQTMTWLIEGEQLHRDSLGFEQLVRPGQLNVTTCGHGVAHSEVSPPDASPRLHGMQIWSALPDRMRNMQSNFKHHASVPAFVQDGIRISIIVGDHEGLCSPAASYWPASAIDLRAFGRPAATRIGLRPTYEYAALAHSGGCEVDGVTLEPGQFLYLGGGRRQLDIVATPNGGLTLLGGEPFTDPIVMWWNFVAGDKQSITEATLDWNAGRRFGRVPGHNGPLDLAPMPPWARKPELANRSEAA